MYDEEFMDESVEPWNFSYEKPEYRIPVQVSLGVDMGPDPFDDSTTIMNFVGSIRLEELIKAGSDIEEILKRKGEPSPNASILDVEIILSKGNVSRYEVRELFSGRARCEATVERYCAQTLEREVAPEEQKKTDAQLFVEHLLHSGVKTTYTVEELAGRENSKEILRDISIPEKLRDEVLNSFEGLLATKPSPEEYKAFQALSKEYTIPELFPLAEANKDLLKMSAWSYFTHNGLRPFHRHEDGISLETAKGFIDGYLGRNISQYAEEQAASTKMLRYLSLPMLAVIAFAGVFAVTVAHPLISEESSDNLSKRIESVFDTQARTAEKAERIKRYKKALRRGRNAKLEDEKNSAQNSAE